MRAAIFRNGGIVVDDLGDPTPSEGQVLVKSLCCGICGSDLHAAKHTPEFVDRSRRSGNRWAMDPERDVVFGHEFCCEVVDHGPGTDKRLKPGTLVCSMPMTIAGTPCTVLAIQTISPAASHSTCRSLNVCFWKCQTVFRRLTPHSLSPLQWAGTPSRRRG